MNTQKQPPEIKKLADYQQPPYWIDAIHLDIDLQEGVTAVQATLDMRANPDCEAGSPLVLEGEEQKLVSVKLDGARLTPDQYTLTDHTLEIPALGGTFKLEIQSEICPEKNKALEGLYKSNAMYCTQCEAEGFRRITYYLDRPDVLAKFTTRIAGDKAKFPILLSNGNPINKGDLDGGRHFVEWEDPFPKPAYLFAMVAGDLACVEDTFKTMSGRAVTLRIFVEHGNEDRCAWAMESLKKSMAWDEQKYGREYDLDIFMIVAVNDFNMGAMENKGLNIFNAKYVLARSDTATDVDYANIEAIIAHEYFHNWTGNRVTCRDWFQLSLKEGLTVFRDQQFSADMRDAAIQRIGDVRTLRSAQFPEDAGPLAHPVQPKSYMEINNFYTATVYEKGAEVIRMMHTLLGADGFRKGTDLYFERHDGEAATVDDFVAAMEHANRKDLTQFKRWYDQSGTPTIDASEAFDAASGEYAVTLSQSHAPTPDQTDKKNLHIPLSLALSDENGLIGNGPEIIELKDASQTFRFQGLTQKPTISLARGFSAPITLKGEAVERSREQQMLSDTDPFNRWDAIQSYATAVLTQQLPDSELTAKAEKIVAAMRSALNDKTLSPAFVAQFVSLPSERDLLAAGDTAEIDKIHKNRSALRARIAETLQPLLRDTYQSLQSNEPYEPNAEQSGRRALRNAALGYLARTAQANQSDLVPEHFRQSNNMTDKIAALSLLADSDHPFRSDALQSFYEDWRDDPVVIEKWFSSQALADREDTLATIKKLSNDQAFSWDRPNCVRALIGAFIYQNPYRFHDRSGSGYQLLAGVILRLDPVNPQIAARLTSAFESWRRLDPARQGAIQARLDEILAAKALSPNVYEIAAKTREI